MGKSDGLSQPAIFTMRRLRAAFYFAVAWWRTAVGGSESVRTRPSPHGASPYGDGFVTGASPRTPLLAVSLSPVPMHFCPFRGGVPRTAGEYR